MPPPPSPPVSRLLLIALAGGALAACHTLPEKPAPIAAVGPEELGWRREHDIDLDLYAPVAERPGQAADVTVIVAISGGGMRAAHFGVGVLKELEESIDLGRYPRARGRTLLQEVDYFSTVSGGGLAAGAYLSALHDMPADQRDSFRLGQALAHGNPALAGLAHNYHVNLVFSPVDGLPVFEREMRADSLEEAIDDYALGAKARGRSLTYGDIFARPGTAPALPYWFANATLVGTGVGFRFAPAELAALKLTGYFDNQVVTPVLAADDLHRPPLELARIFAMPLAVGATASASFPGIIPATTLLTAVDPARPYVHLLDGGVSDNLGYRTALEIFKKTPTPGQLLIVIDAFAGRPSPFSAQIRPPHWFEQVANAGTLPLASARAHMRDDLDRAKALDPQALGHLAYVIIDFDLLASHAGDDPEAVADRALAAQARRIGTWFDSNESDRKILQEVARRCVARSAGELQRALETAFGKPVN